MDGLRILASIIQRSFNIFPAGAHHQGETYQGCYGFQWTFTHDSYAYTGFMEDTTQGICPACEGTHAHTPYQSAGVNEKGLSITATETLIGIEQFEEVDPYKPNGIEEAEITTVLLSEAATAREAMLLLTSIYAETGAYYGAGVIAADREEAWYIECMSGTQYAAVKMNPDILMVNPNLSVIGRIDLDDSEHVVCSKALIDTAIAAGTFVGDKEANVIDYASSYCNTKYTTSELRMRALINYLTASDTFDITAEGWLTNPEMYAITNLDPDGNLVPLHTPIQAAIPLNLKSVINGFRVQPAARDMNAETHVFEVNLSDSTETGFVEWVGMGYCGITVFVPCYPMLINEVHPSLCIGRGQAEMLKEKPESGVCFEMEKGWVVYPDGWENSMYWVFEGLYHVAMADESAAKDITAAMLALQDEVYDAWAALQTLVSQTDVSKAETATQGSMAIAEMVYQRAKTLLDTYLGNASIK